MAREITIDGVRYAPVDTTREITIDGVRYAPVDTTREITIDGVRYALVDTTCEHLQIAVLDRGFVVVGKASIKDNYVTIRDGSCIRRWGTTRGLGQLANDGPQPETKLDPQPTTRVHELQVVQLIDCEEGAWTQ